MEFRTNIPVYLFFMILICSLSVDSLVITSQANWGIEPGFQKVYVLDESSWSITYGGLSATGEGGTFQELRIAQGDSFSINVVQVDNNYGVEYILENQQEQSSTGFVDKANFIYEFANFLYYPTEEAGRLDQTGFNEEEIMLGPPIISWFFIEPTEDLWEFLEEVTTLEYHNSLQNADEFEGTLEADFAVEGENKVFDFYLRGDYINETKNIEIRFDHNIKFIWKISTGLLQGYRISSQFLGEYFGNEISEELNVACRVGTYSLPYFKFGGFSGLISGFRMGIVITSGLVIVTIYQLMKKRKN
ncbi:MAG: hypothetical protein GF308_11035 [Candidatus Heimdallarchaeota archaeon]|nr:hypothetical protein [Candidatus Heimdallarchaeota archaeon]